MNIVVIVRQVPDLIEPLELDPSGAAGLDMDEVSFIVNEADDHALEQALLLKEAAGGAVTVLALDFGEVDDTLYAAAAKGADRIVKIPYDEEHPPAPREAAAMFAEAIKNLDAEMVLVGSYAHDELEGVLAPMLAAKMDMPYLGVIRGVKPAEPGSVTALKEYPGAVMAQMNVKLPAVLGILAAEQPPRYVPVSRIRNAMKTAEFEEREVAAAAHAPTAMVTRMYTPEVAEHATMIAGSEEEVAARIADILEEKGVLK